MRREDCYDRRRCCPSCKPNDDPPGFFPRERFGGREFFPRDEFFEEFPREEFFEEFPRERFFRDEFEEFPRRRREEFEEFPRRRRFR